MGKKRSEGAWEKLRKRERELSKRLTAWEKDRAYFRDEMKWVFKIKYKRETYGRRKEELGREV